MFPDGILTWAKRGSDNVHVHANCDEKKCMTALATVKVDGTKLPLMIIAKGKPDLVETTQLGVWVYTSLGTRRAVG